MREYLILTEYQGRIHRESGTLELKDMKNLHKGTMNKGTRGDKNGIIIRIPLQLSWSGNTYGNIFKKLILEKVNSGKIFRGQILEILSLKIKA